MTAAAPRQQLAKLTYTHDAMIDLILQEPTVTHAELAQLFGYSPQWIRTVCNSDAFLARLAERRSAIVDPLIARSVNDRLRQVTLTSVALIQEKLTTEQSANFALEALGVSTAALAPRRNAKASAA